MSLAADKAMNYAKAFHEFQMYGDKPYIYHLGNVASKCLEFDEKVVAYLHDILEDTEATEDGLRFNFASYIVDAVVAMTKVKGETKNEYISKVCKNPLARQVKIYDTLSNLEECVRQKAWSRAKKYSFQLESLLNFKGEL